MNEVPKNKEENTQYFADKKTNDVFLSIFGNSNTQGDKNEIRKANDK